MSPPRIGAPRRREKTAPARLWANAGSFCSTVTRVTDATRSRRLLLAGTVVDPNCVGVLSLAIVRVGHLGVVERIRAAQRLSAHGRPKTLAQEQAATHMRHFRAIGLGRCGAVVALRAVRLDAANGATRRDGRVATRGNRDGGNANEYGKR